MSKRGKRENVENPSFPILDDLFSSHSFLTDEEEEEEEEDEHDDNDDEGLGFVKVSLCYSQTVEVSRQSGSFTCFFPSVEAF